MRTCHWLLILGAVALVWPTAAGAEELTSEAMAQRIASTIRESGQLSNYRVGVKYDDGVAWLLGNVTDQAQAKKAMALASKIEGVDHVVNKLEITPTEVKPATGVKGEDSDSNVLLALESQAEPATLESVPAPKALPAATKRMAKPAPRQVAQRGTAQRQMRRSTQRRMPVPMARTTQNRGQQVQQASSQRPVRPTNYGAPCGPAGCGPQGAGGYVPAGGMGGAQGVSYDSPSMPGYAWPSYASHPNYAAVTYPKQYSPTAWPYIGPFYPYPQVPLGWRKVALEWDDGWWHLDFSHHQHH